ncbi:MAG: DUF3795 domain-containing protein [Firmicutes bacterium]|nr:DUF3795 domain-containing protein [Bacillota bacterium]
MKQTDSEPKGHPTKRYPTIGVCGLDCGLCPRYYTVGASRCPGCGGPDFFHKHPSCSFITCCVKKKNLEVCGECSDFPCPKFKSGEEYQQLEESSSYPSYKKVMVNLRFVREHGIERFVEEQKRRIRLLETMIEGFDEGRSRSFFCKAATLLDLASLRGSLDEAARRIIREQIKQDDVRNKARILKAVLNEFALKDGVELVRKK